MKKLLLTAVSLALMGATALAADLPSRKAEPLLQTPPSPMWTGFYVGLNAGGTWSNSSNINAKTQNIYQPAGSGDYTGAAVLTGSLPLSGAGGFFGGGQIGYNWQTQVSGLSFVAGIEADIQGVGGSGGNGDRWAVVPDAGHSGGERPELLNEFSITSNMRGTAQLNWLGTVRGRIGYIVTPTLLIYGTGGFAYGGYSAQAQSMIFWQNKSVRDVHFIQFGSTGFSNTNVGWTAGGGVEWMFMPNWSAKAEYLYYDLGSAESSVVNPFFGIGRATGRNDLQSVTNYSTRLNGNIVRAGVNYHFNWGAAPVVAKY